MDVAGIVVNVPGRGYRFVAPLSVADGEMPPLRELQPRFPKARAATAVPYRSGCIVPGTARRESYRTRFF
jgi:DNA-binding winged helix-turn-helix (wHTH) protein